MRTHRSLMAVFLGAVLLTATSGLHLFGHTCRMLRVTHVTLEQPVHRCGHDAHKPVGHHPDTPAVDRQCCDLQHAELRVKEPFATQTVLVLTDVPAVLALAPDAAAALGLLLPTTAPDLQADTGPPLAPAARRAQLQVYRI